MTATGAGRPAGGYRVGMPLAATHRRYSYVWAVVVVAASAVAVGQPAGTSGSATRPGSAQDWVLSYSRHPSPDRFEAKLKELAGTGVFRNERASVPMTAFVARLMADNPDRLDGWVTAVGRLNESDRPVLIRALRQADTGPARKRLKQLADDGGADAAVAAEAMGEPVVRFDKLTATEMLPEQLDGCWWSFFATGDRAYADAVFRCAALPGRPNAADLNRAAARWSAASLAKADDRVAAALVAYVANASAADRASLEPLAHAGRPPAATKPATRPAATHPTTRVGSAEEWMRGYHRHPTPDQFADRIAELAADHLLMDGTDAGDRVGFFARLMAHEPDRLDAWIVAVDTLDAGYRPVLFDALRQADTQATRKQLARLMDAGSPDANAAFAAACKAVVHLKQLRPAAMTPDQVDECWGAFFETGNRAYLGPVFGCAALPTQSGVYYKGSASAQFMTSIYVHADDDVAAALDEYVEKAPAAERAELQPYTRAAAAATSRPATRP